MLDSDWNSNQTLSALTLLHSSYVQSLVANFYRNNKPITQPLKKKKYIFINSTSLYADYTMVACSFWQKWCDFLSVYLVPHSRLIASYLACISDSSRVRSRSWPSTDSRSLRSRSRDTCSMVIENTKSYQKSFKEMQLLAVNSQKQFKKQCFLTCDY